MRVIFLLLLMLSPCIGVKLGDELTWNYVSPDLAKVRRSLNYKIPSVPAEDRLLSVEQVMSNGLQKGVFHKLIEHAACGNNVALYWLIRIAEYFEEQDGVDLFKMNSMGLSALFCLRHAQSTTHTEHSVSFLPSIIGKFKMDEAENWRFTKDKFDDSEKKFLWLRARGNEICKAKVFQELRALNRDCFCPSLACVASCLLLPERKGVTKKLDGQKFEGQKDKKKFADILYLLDDSSMGFYQLGWHLMHLQNLIHLQKTDPQKIEIAKKAFEEAATRGVLDAWINLTTLESDPLKRNCLHTRALIDLEGRYKGGEKSDLILSHIISLRLKTAEFSYYITGNLNSVWDLLMLSYSDLLKYHGEINLGDSPTAPPFSWDDLRSGTFFLLGQVMLNHPTYDDARVGGKDRTAKIQILLTLSKKDEAYITLGDMALATQDYEEAVKYYRLAKKKGKKQLIQMVIDNKSEMQDEKLALLIQEVRSDPCRIYFEAKLFQRRGRESKYKAYLTLAAEKGNETALRELEDINNMAVASAVAVPAVAEKLLSQEDVTEKTVTKTEETSETRSPNDSGSDTTDTEAVVAEETEDYTEAVTNLETAREKSDVFAATEDEHTSTERQNYGKYTVFWSKRQHYTRKLEFSRWSAVIRLLKAIEEKDDSIGNLHPLTQEPRYKGCLSRKISQEHRLVYKVDHENKRIDVLECGGHYK